MTKNQADSVQHNELEFIEECREMGEEDVLAEEMLEHVTGGGGILDVLAHRGYVADSLNVVPPEGVDKPEASFELPRKKGKRVSGANGMNPLPFGLWHDPSKVSASSSAQILSKDSTFQPFTQTQPVPKTDA